MARTVITENDFWETDNTLWDKLRETKDPAVVESVGLVLRYEDFFVDKSNPIVRLQPKIRSIEPDVVTDRGTLLLSAFRYGVPGLP